MIIYHGSSRIIRAPEFGYGSRFNDYGLGFYCTESLDLAKEWACVDENDGYANEYSIELSGLDILRLSDGRYSILHWLSVLLANRRFELSSDLGSRAKQYLMDHFMPNYEGRDIIIGYRADDSYFSFASAFLNNNISLAQLEKAMYLGKLGEQVVIKSRKAFDRLEFVSAISAEGVVYHSKRMKRDSEARQAFKDERARHPEDAVYMIDILREEWKDGDARLRKNISG